MDPFIVELLLTRIRAYFFGYLASFTQWVSHLDSVLPTLGLTTFAGPSNLADIIERPLGFYDAHFIAPGDPPPIFIVHCGD